MSYNRRPNHAKYSRMEKCMFEVPKAHMSRFCRMDSNNQRMGLENHRALTLQRRRLQPKIHEREFYLLVAAVFHGQQTFLQKSGKPAILG